MGSHPAVGGITRAFFLKRPVSGRAFAGKPDFGAPCIPCWESLSTAEHTAAQRVWKGVQFFLWFNGLVAGQALFATHLSD